MVKDKDEAKTFELGEQLLSREGTSGPSAIKQELATGDPVFHSASFGGQTLSLSDTSGISTYQQYTAERQPSDPGSAAGETGAESTSRPAVIADSAGISAAGETGAESTSRPTVIADSAGISAAGETGAESTSQPAVIAGSAGIYPK
jgi:hypothetical protein